MSASLSELNEQFLKLRRWRVKPERDVGVRKMIQRAASNPAAFAASAAHWRGSRPNRRSGSGGS